MKTTEVMYRMTRVTRQFENDVAAVTIQIEEGDDVQAALDEALVKGREAAVQGKLLAALGDPRKRKAVETLLDTL